MNENQKGYSLKKRKLKDWIYDNGRTQPYVARKLGITKAELQQKLNEHEPFNEQQIRSLLWRAPEPSKLAEVKKKYPAIKKIVYPAPPITLCETEYYGSIFDDCELVLDNNLQLITKLAATKKICLSVSDYQTERKLHYNFLNCLVKELIVI